MHLSRFGAHRLGNCFITVSVSCLSLSYTLNQLPAKIENKKPQNIPHEGLIHVYPPPPKGTRKQKKTQNIPEKWMTLCAQELQ